MHVPVCGDIKLYHFVQKHFFLPTIISLLLLQIQTYNYIIMQPAFSLQKQFLLLVM